MLHFGSQILKEFYIVRGVRRAINNTEKFNGKVTVKSKTVSKKFKRLKSVDTRAGFVFAYVNTTASLDRK